MTEHRPRFWEYVRPWFHEFFQFWPDGEDLIWAKSVWPIMEDAGFFSDHDDEADAWTRKHILGLAILYAESACRFGTPDYRWFPQVERGWLTVAFGSENNLDDILFAVGSTVRDHFPHKRTFEKDPAFFTPLIRSLVTGSGFYSEGPPLEDYLARAEKNHFDMCEFREDDLCRLWIGGNFARRDMVCFP